MSAQWRHWEQVTWFYLTAWRLDQNTERNTQCAFLVLKFTSIQKVDVRCNSCYTTVSRLNIKNWKFTLNYYFMLIQADSMNQEQKTNNRWVSCCCFMFNTIIVVIQIWFNTVLLVLDNKSFIREAAVCDVRAQVWSVQCVTSELRCDPAVCDVRAQVCRLVPGSDLQTFRTLTSRPPDRTTADVLWSGESGPMKRAGVNHVSDYWSALRFWCSTWSVPEVSRCSGLLCYSLLFPGQRLLFSDRAAGGASAPQWHSGGSDQRPHRSDHSDQ